MMDAFWIYFPSHILWDPNHQNFMDHEIFFLTNIFFHILKTSFNWEKFCWFTNKKSTFSTKSKHKKTDSWYLVKEILGDPQNFGGSDPTNMLEIASDLNICV